MIGTKIFDEPVGLVRRAKIIKYDNLNKTIKIQLNTSTSVKGNASLIDIPIPTSLLFDNGLFIGSKPKEGSDIIVAQGSGNQYYYVSSVPNSLLNIPDLPQDTIVVQSSELSKILLSNEKITLGSDDLNIELNSTKNYYSNYYGNKYSISEANITINGLIKREKNHLLNNSDLLKLKDNEYYLSRSSIGLDPKINTNNLSETFNKNPPLVEIRSVINEFQKSSNVLNDFSESLFYKNQKEENDYSYPDRRKLRSNVLNLSLNNPNDLIEKIEGTVVDIFGNVLDINRYPIKFDKSFSEDSNNDKTETFFKIKDLQRKGIAYHFELNSKKDIDKVPDVNDSANYSRNRSRFFIDVDKEGQFKANISCSSEIGNIPVLTRYENYSHISEEDNKNPNKLIFREDGLDVLHDSFNKGFIEIKNELGEIVTPIDRFTNQHIKHGTAYHDLSKTCIAHQSLDFINYQNDETIALNNTYISKDFISKEIFISGENANAGGRSGLISLDGSLELNVGANTSDRQSLVFDFAGGVLGNIGRDRNNNSMVYNLDGNMIIQIGGTGVDGDSRFSKLNNGYLGGTLDIRVLRPGFQATLLRIDSEGVKILTAGRMLFHANSDVVIKSDATMTLEAENLILNNRMVLKEFGGSI